MLDHEATVRILVIFIILWCVAFASFLGKMYFVARDGVSMHTGRPLLKTWGTYTSELHNCRWSKYTDPEIVKACSVIIAHDKEDLERLHQWELDQIRKAAKNLSED